MYIQCKIRFLVEETISLTLLSISFASVDRNNYVYLCAFEY
jgi:hypothetical protein